MQQIFENWNFWTAIGSEVTCRLQKWKKKANRAKIAISRADFQLFTLQLFQHFRLRKKVPKYIHLEVSHSITSAHVKLLLLLLQPLLEKVCKKRRNGHYKNKVELCDSKVPQLDPLKGSGYVFAKCIETDWLFND